MLYFSELKGKDIYTETHKLIGKLTDLLFRAEDVPLITKIVLETQKNKEKLYVPLADIQSLNGTIVLKSHFHKQEYDDRELYVGRSLQDQQIIDVKGNKVMRINDVSIQDKDEPAFYISGVDVGLRGILRWIKLEKVTTPFYQLLHQDSKPHFLSWTDIQPLELAKGDVRVRTTDERLKKIRPEDLADHLEKTTIRNVDKIIEVLDAKYAVRVVKNLNINYQTALFTKLSQEKIVQILGYADTEEAADMIFMLPSHKRKEIIDLLPDKKRKELRELLKIPRTSIRHLVHTNFLTVNPMATVDSVIKTVKEQTNEYSYLNAIYVSNEENRLIGVFNLHELLLQDPNNQAFKFMHQNVIVIHENTPKEVAFNKMVKYSLQEIPIIGSTKTIVGIVTFDELSKSLFGNS